MRNWVALVAVLGALAGCRREQVTHFRVKKQPAQAPAAGQTDLASAGMGAGEVPPPPTPSGDGALKWTLPKGWTESGAGGGMRYATLKPPVQGRVDVSVTVLPGQAGGELANVNRWRGQIGLGAIDEPALAAARKVLRTKAGPVSVYDFANDGEARSRLVAGLAAAKDGSTWFVKMSGDAAPVAAARADFLRILESLRFEEAR
jgi:hypothetical protein